MSCVQLYVTTRFIDEGEELLIDYGAEYWNTVEDASNWKKVVKTPLFLRL